MWQGIICLLRRQIITPSANSHTILDAYSICYRGDTNMWKRVRLNCFLLFSSFFSCSPRVRTLPNFFIFSCLFLVFENHMNFFNHVISKLSFLSVNVDFVVHEFFLTHMDIFV